MYRIILGYLTLTLSLWEICYCTDFAGASVDEAPDGKSGAIKFTTPSLDDEEAHSQHMPVALKCDGCKAVAYQLALAFNKVQNKKPSKRLTESQIVDITETVCTKGFEQYGIKQVNGKKQLTGPGLPAGDAPGIMQGGGRWPTRLQSMCGNYVGELGEEEIYDAYRDDKQLVNTLCNGDGDFGYCAADRKKDEL